MRRFLLLALPLILLFLAMACVADKNAQTPDPTDSASSPVDESGSGGGNAQVDPRPLNTPTQGTPVAQKQITGLFQEPRQAKVNKVKLPTKPESPFQPHDRTSVVVYDSQNGRATGLGPGLVAPPVFGANSMVYTNANEAWLVDLSNFNKTDLGPADLAFFLDDQNVILVDLRHSTQVVNITNNNKSQSGNLASTAIGYQDSSFLGGPQRRTQVDGGYIVRYALDTEKVYRADCLNLAATDAALCGARLKEEFVIEDDKGMLLYQFRAMSAYPAGPGEVVVATSPLCDDGTGKQVWCEEVLYNMEAQNPRDIQWAKGTTNIFVIDIASGKAKFIATARYDPPTRIRPFNWPLSANSDYVTWTESYCNSQPGNTRIYDRKSGSIRELDQSLWVKMQGGMLGAGEFGAKALIDPKSLQYKSVLTHNLKDVYWSPDNHFAVVGQDGQHAGLCGGN